MKENAAMITVKISPIFQQRHFYFKATNKSLLDLQHNQQESIHGWYWKRIQLPIVGEFIDVRG